MSLEHPFAHLGPAPYRFVGMFSIPSKSLLEANPEAYYRAIAESPLEPGRGTGACACCGTYITNIYIIECGDRSRWGVGCDCILKLAREPRLISAVKKAKREADAAARHAREDAKVAEAVDWFNVNETALRALPHIQPWRAAKGETLADCVSWYLKNAGVTGKLAMVKQAQKLLSDEVMSTCGFCGWEKCNCWSPALPPSYRDTADRSRIESTFRVSEMRETLRQMLEDWNAISEDERAAALSTADLKATERAAHALRSALLRTIRLEQVKS